METLDRSPSLRFNRRTCSPLDEAFFKAALCSSAEIPFSISDIFTTFYFNNNATRRVGTLVAVADSDIETAVVVMACRKAVAGQRDS